VAVVILVDYANVDPLIKSRGVEGLAFQIVETIGSSYFDAAESVTIRLYGGWFEGDEYSRLAQALAAEIGQSFPRPIHLTSDGISIPLRMNVELARSILIDPSHDLFHTFRPRGLPGGIQCQEPPFIGCTLQERCPLAPISSFFRERSCPTPDCAVRPKQVLSRPEQKLVDTMLVVDLLHLVMSGSRVAVVGSDDDLWPGIRMALSIGGSIIHMHSKKGQSTPAFYKRRVPTAYIELHLVS
jgi:hypothetical protein